MLRNKTQSAKRRARNAERKVFEVLAICFAFCAIRCAFAQEQFVYDSKGKRNPFIPLLTTDGRFLKLEQGEAPEGLLLEGIIYDKQARSYAIVNGSVVGIGDAVGGYQVLKIEEDKVTFIKDGEPKELELKKEDP